VTAQADRGKDECPRQAGSVSSLAKRRVFNGVISTWKLLCGQTSNGKPNSGNSYPREWDGDDNVWTKRSFPAIREAQRDR
jgi:hypothetical protein